VFDLFALRLCECLGPGRQLGEPPRDCRRLHFLRGWSHGKTKPVFPGGP
jgi:hypothetical protein